MKPMVHRNIYKTRMSRRKYTCLNYNKYSEENKETNKYGMTDETNEDVKTQKKENRYGSDSYDRNSTNRYSDKNRQ